MNINSDLRLVVPLQEFKHTLTEKCKEFNPDTKVKADDDLDSVRKLYNKWYQEISNYYQTSFNKSDNAFVDELEEATTGGRYYVTLQVKSLGQLKERYNRIQGQILRDINLITACELLYADKEKAHTLTNRDYTVDEKHKLILRKLYELRGDRGYPLTRILTWNGVNLVRYDEATELGEQLKKRGLIRFSIDYDSDKSDYAKITSKGEQLVENERKRERKKPDSNTVSKEKKLTNSKNIFIVHGHDKATKLELKELIKDEFKLNPVILGDKPMKSLNTIFHKIDEHARDCSAAIVLMTPDDKIGEESRARENVLLDLGYFIGLFPPDDRKVLILRKANANIPSDIQGVERIDFKESIEEIHLKLRKQFKFWGLIK